MKRMISVFCIIAVFFCFASCGSSKNMASVYIPPQSAPEEQASLPAVQPAAPAVQESAREESPAFDSPAENPMPLPIITPVPLQDPVPAAAPVQSAEIQNAGSQSSAAVSSGCTAEGGGHSIEVLSAVKDKDYTGADVVVIAFEYTNNSSASNSFSNIANIRVTQNGKALEGDGVVMDQSTFNGLAYNFTKEVKVGQSIKCVYAYFTSSGDPVDVSVEIFNDFLNRKVLGSASCTLSVG